MRAAIFHQGKFVVDSIPDPVLAEGQVLVRTRACGICGSDLHAAKFPKQFAELSRRSGNRFSMRDDVDIVFGHEFVGEIAALGPGTTGRFPAGTMVTSMPLTIAGTTVMSIGYNPDVPGAFAEYIPLAERMLLEVPSAMQPDHAALVEPMAVGEHAAVYARLVGDEVPLVIGCGPVGLAVIAALKLRGLNPIIAADFSPGRRRLAALMGADVVIDPAATSPYETLTQAITPAGFDASRYLQLMGTALKRRQAVLFECVGVPGVMNAMFEGAPQGARIVIVGVCMETDRFEPFFGILKHLDVQFVLGYSPEEFAGTLGNIAAGRIDVAPLITGRVGLDGVQAAFADLANPETHAKILVEPQPLMSNRGQSLRRVEDERFLTGRGRFIEDIDLPGQCWMQVVRSPHAHATIGHIDTAGPLAMPGVLGVFSAADFSDIGVMPCTTPVASLQPMIVPPRHALATGRVRHVGDPVAFVVAETRDAARNAAEVVAVDYDDLPAVVDPVAALQDGAPQLWDEAPGNLSYRFQKGDADAVRRAIAGAAHVVELELVNNRIVVAATETRGAIGSYDEHGFHLQFSGAGVHGLRSQLADDVFRVPPERMRVSCPDVGGGFGVKNALHPEFVMLLWAARHLGRPVKWIGERAEDFLSTAQGRGNFTRARLALDAEGKFLALEADTVAELGAYMSTGGPGSSTNAPVNAIGSGYVIPAISMDVRGVFTNTVPIDAYRGAGKPEVNYMIERLIDEAARRCGFDPVALRRRNLVTSFPYRKALGSVIDCGRFADNLDDALIAADHVGFAARRDAARVHGRLRGIGVTCFMETARGAPNEGAEIRFDADGKVALLVGTQSNGNGHETTYPQIAADLLGLPLDIFRYVQADTAVIPDGNGHGGARSMHMGGSALFKAVQVLLEKASAIAARLLQASASQVAFVAGSFVIRDDPSRKIDLMSVADAARDPANLAPGETPGLDTYVWNLLDLITFPNGCHIAEVEVDPETGVVTLERYTAVDDFGTLLNPMLTLGQIQGGVVQGIGQAMLEHTVYDPESGQMLSGSLMDYTLPRAADIPPLDITFNGVPTSANPLGVKGAGQAGAIAAPQAVVCAVLDALVPLGVTHIDMPLTPERVWQALRQK